jgi:hypothetical protein
MTILEPKLFQNIVRFMEQAAIEAIEITEVMRVAAPAAPLFDPPGHFFLLGAHAAARTLPALPHFGNSVALCVFWNPHFIHPNSPHQPPLAQKHGHLNS